MNEVALVTAFTAGFVSFLAPCVLPIIPGFLAYLAGSRGGVKASRLEIFLNSLFFVAGFSFIFALLGVLLNTVLETVAYDVQVWLARIGGVLIIFFGLYLTGLIKIGILEREHKFKVALGGRSKYITSFIFGLAFAAGWTPCVGPVLGVILGLAASSPGIAFFLLLSYALGLGVPFLIVGLFTAQAAGFISRYAKVLSYANIVFGVILIVLGVLVFTEQLNRIASFELLNNFLLQ
jgi:cytochrome c-type biogenesis protein